MEHFRVGEFVVDPVDRPGFDGPVVLLVSRHTASAAEVFGMSLLERVPKVTIIGEQSAIAKHKIRAAARVKLTPAPGR